MNNSKLFTAPLALALTLGLTACGGGAGGDAGTTAAGSGSKDPITQGRNIIWEPADKNLTEMTYEAENDDVEISLDVENGTVTDVMLECTSDQMTARLDEWTKAYDGLDFAVIYDERSDEDFPSVRVCFYGLEDSARAKKFVDTFGGDIFALGSEGLIEEQATVEALKAAGYVSWADQLEAGAAELEEISELLDSIANEDGEA